MINLEAQIPVGGALSHSNRYSHGGAELLRTGMSGSQCKHPARHYLVLGAFPLRSSIFPVFAFMRMALAGWPVSGS